MTTSAVQLELSRSVTLSGTLALPVDPQGLVLFAHGSGSNRMSPFSLQVAGVLRRAGFATLLFDLLTAGEERLDRATGQLRFDMELLRDRLVRTTRWTAAHQLLNELRVGYFGASRGAAAALMAAGDLGDQVSAVVALGGRLDLAGDRLLGIRAATLLIVGGQDMEVVQRNEVARHKLTCDCAMHVIPRAGRPWEEAGAIEEVARLASEWFQTYLSPVARGIDLGSRVVVTERDRR